MLKILKRKLNSVYVVYPELALLCQSYRLCDGLFLVFKHHCMFIFSTLYLSFASFFILTKAFEMQNRISQIVTSLGQNEGFYW